MFYQALQMSNNTVTTLLSHISNFYEYKMNDSNLHLQLLQCFSGV